MKNPFEHNHIEGTPHLERYISPIGAWGLALGCAVGWGAFVMPVTTFLPIAGPMGTAIGMGISTILMLLIGANFHYMMNRHPDAGGSYSYTKHIFGYDHGFLCAWFLVLVYLAILWANATALPIIFRNLLGKTFQFGFHYRVVDFDIYFGEVALSLAAIWGLGLLCMCTKRIAIVLQTLLAILLAGGVTIIFCSIFGRKGIAFPPAPSFVPGKSIFPMVFGIISLSPWAFAGFESISHSVEEFKFSPKKAFLVMFLAVVIAGFLYIALNFIAASVPPSGYSSWVEYIAAPESTPDRPGNPIIFITENLLGRWGFVLLAMTIIAGVGTGIIGNFIAASRLVYSMTKDNLFPQWFGKTDSSHTPAHIILLLILISTPIPFLGRTAINWIVDVNSIGATIAYVYTSAAVFCTARKESNLLFQTTGIIGTAISTGFLIHFLLPNFWIVDPLSSASLLILIGWSILVILIFRHVFHQDTRRRFGNSTIVWIFLLFLIFFTSMLWLRRVSQKTTNMVLNNLEKYNVEELAEHGVTLNGQEESNADQFLENQMILVNESLTKNCFIQMAIILISLCVLFNIFKSIMKRENQSQLEKARAEQNNLAKGIFLSNMSHDIRTPMNAIIGYVGLAQKVENLPPKAGDYLEKVNVSCQHLLALINDILELSKIESGKIELNITEGNLPRMMEEVHQLFAKQMEMKKIDFSVVVGPLANSIVLCDVNRINRILLNLISNAFKFTEEGGKVLVSLEQTAANEKTAFYAIRVQDTGMGMSPEFVEKIFDAYERDRTVNHIPGTGLGMAITKNLLDLMGGTIQVRSTIGEGTEFLVQLEFALPEMPQKENPSNLKDAVAQFNASQFRILLVDDNEINREIATLILKEEGFLVDTARNGKEAVDMVAKSTPDFYQAVLMDIQMPVMNGYEATKAIRSLSDPKLAAIPVIAMTANAFAEDVQAAKEVGMDGHISKPIKVAAMMETLRKNIR